MGDTCRAGAGDRDQGSARSAVGRNSGGDGTADGAGSSDSSDWRATGRSHGPGG